MDPHMPKDPREQNIMWDHTAKLIRPLLSELGWRGYPQDAREALERWAAAKGITYWEAAKAIMSPGSREELINWIKEKYKKV